MYHGTKSRQGKAGLRAAHRAKNPLDFRLILLFFHPDGKQLRGRGQEDQRTADEHPGFHTQLTLAPDLIVKSNDSTGAYFQPL